MATEDRKLCPICGNPMTCKLKDFSIGADGNGGLMALFSDQYHVDLYACPQCGKVELYTAGFRHVPADKLTAPYWCNYCQRENWGEECARCARPCIPMEDHRKLLLADSQPSHAPSGHQDPSDPKAAAEPEKHGFRFSWQKDEKAPWEK